MLALAANDIGDAGGPIALAETEPLFRGYQRLVFQHPLHADQMIKVMRNDYVEQKFGPHSPLHNRNRRCRQYHLFLRELREYLVACAWSPASLPFLQEIVGLAQTDLGLGMVVRKVMGPDGKLAVSLSKLIQRLELTPERLRALERTLEALLASSIVVDDVHAGNLVLGVSPAGEERFVLIDGIGSSTFIPLKAMVAWTNRVSKRRRFAELRQEIEKQGREAQLAAKKEGA